MTEQRRLAAILVADVVGYSKLVGSDEVGTLAKLTALKRDVIEPAIARHTGRLFKAMGDGFLVEFASAVQAVEAARAIQQANVEGDLPLRIGIHVGDVVVQGDDLMGDGVNTAARIEGVAEPGGIALSRQVHDQVRDRLDINFADKGEIELKNIARPVHVFALAGTKTVASAPALALPDKPSIAVLPFQNMSGDPEQEYFADGVVEDIITALSRIPSFFVIARNSSFIYKGRAVDLRQVGRELGVRYVLEGSVRKAGARLRITGQLIDTASGRHVWAERYEGAVEDVFDLQDRITSSVVAAIEPKVTFAEISRAQAKPTDSLTAYDLYLRAVALGYEYKKEADAEAVALLERAVAADPNFSSAWGLLANRWWIRRFHDWVSFEEASAQGLYASRKAIETGRDDPDALARGGLGIAVHGLRAREGLAHIERALELNPNSCVATRYAAAACILTGEHERAKDLHERALQLSPKDPWAFDTTTSFARLHFYAGRYDEALTLIDKALVERPTIGSMLLVKVSASAMAGRPTPETEEAVARLLSAMPGASVTTVVGRMTYFRQVDRDLMTTALRKAGLPE